MLIWVLAGVTLGNYNIGLQVTIPLIIQPELFAFIALICVIQELYYNKKWSKTNSFLAFGIILIISGALQVGLVYAFRRAEADGNDRAIQFFGILPVVTILVGFLPQYWDIFVHRRVEGISFIFLFMDFFGSVFSTISLAFRPTIDALSLVNYIGIAIFDVGIVVLYYIFKCVNGNQGITSKKDEEKDEEETIQENPQKS
ncbi:unnamed protein product [Cunninghamella blakesleeana]